MTGWGDSHFQLWIFGKMGSPPRPLGLGYVSPRDRPAFPYTSQDLILRLVQATLPFIPTPFTEQQTEAEGEAALTEDLSSGLRLAGT